jgi:tetratricopeptide (TPR) repeat protein
MEEEMRLFKLASAVSLLMAVYIFLGCAGKKPDMPLEDTQAYEEPIVEPVSQTVQIEQEEVQTEQEEPALVEQEPPTPEPKDEDTSVQPQKVAQDHISDGNAYLKNGEYDEAIESFSQALELDTENTDAYMGSGKAHFAKKEYQGAIKDFETVISIRPRDVDAYYGLGVAYAAIDNYDGAIENLTKAIRYDPTLADIYVDFYKERGFVYLAKNDYTRAIQDFERLINSGSGDPNVYSGRGFAYLARGNYAKAVLDLTEALKRLPDAECANAYNGRGFSYYNAGDYDAAIKDFNQAIKVASENPYSHYGLAKVYFDQGDYEKAEDITADWEERFGIITQQSVETKTVQQVAEDEILKKSIPTVSE